ncbi:DUF2189 domain-containing protein [Oceaniovalibus sp. ACAM 378]|uniref:DUF2189 domain-containing protein n=1 Tax=Oceaniovalibus sp. ACAM 378 TaxID=2599923 RepID=UPI0011D73B77|nr:DUF2189 domain-containing protein [Oceaniovalibus sp. ACAM 378]TYB87923.1 DUF2189 domain-containing protein [Oceaniovalibus sp. ACAM 378]
MLSDRTNDPDVLQAPDPYPESDGIPKVVPPLPRENQRAQNLPWRTAFSWLRAGWSDLWNHPIPSLLYGIGVFVVSLAIVWAMFLFNYEYALFPALAGFMVVGPMIANGLYEKSRMIEAGEKPSYLRMAFVRPKSGAQAWFMGVMLLGLLMLWLRAAVLIWALFFGINPFPGTDEILPMLFTTPTGWALLLVGGSVGALFAAFSFAISVFAVPMLLEERTDALSALGISMATVWNNLPVMIAWGTIVLGLFVLSVATAFIGLIVIFPLLGHGTWHAYRALRPVDRQHGDSERMFIRPA